jgi:hypothetical protein
VIASSTVAALPGEILAESTVLFDDVRATDIDPEVHAAFVISRVLDRGTFRSVSALLKRYGEHRVRSFFTDGGALQVSRRTWALWRAFLSLTDDECTPRSSPRVRSPYWKD